MVSLEGFGDRSSPGTARLVAASAVARPLLVFVAALALNSNELKRAGRKSPVNAGVSGFLQRSESL